MPRPRSTAARAAVGARPGRRTVREPPAPVCAGPLGWDLVEEDARLDPRSGYAASKLAQEHYAAAWARQAGGSAVALRYHNVYGPGMPRDTPYSGVAAMFRSAVERGEPPRVFEDGGQMRDFVHVDDVARANVLALEAVVDDRARRPGGVQHLLRAARSRSSTWHASWRVTGRRPRSPVSTDSATSGTSSRRRSGRATELGFKAEIAPDEGLARFATDPLRA